MNKTVLTDNKFPAQRTALSTTRRDRRQKRRRRCTRWDERARGPKDSVTVRALRALSRERAGVEAEFDNRGASTVSRRKCGRPSRPSRAGTMPVATVRSPSSRPSPIDRSADVVLPLFPSLSLSPSFSFLALPLPETPGARPRSPAGAGGDDHHEAQVLPDGEEPA